MICPDREKIFGYVQKFLSAREERSVGLHLASCAACGRIQQEYQKVDGLLGEWQPPDPTPDFSARVRQAVRALPEKTVWSLWGFEWPRVWAPSVAALIIAAAGIMLQPSPQAPREQLISPVSVEDELALLADLPLLEDYDLLEEFDILSELVEENGESAN